MSQVEPASNPGSTYKAGSSDEPLPDLTVEEEYVRSVTITDYRIDKEGSVLLKLRCLLVSVGSGHKLP